jgi:hypothetical protein
MELFHDSGIVFGPPEGLLIDLIDNIPHLQAGPCRRALRVHPGNQNPVAGV